MKKFIYTTIAFMFMLILIGCAATMTSEERKETYDMRKEVGNRQFVGDSRSNTDAVGMTKNIYW